MEHPPSPGASPAVGNVLGFSLLLRDRQALLRLERRTLVPGVRVLDFEAEVPDVEFPLRTQGAAAFRRRRCRTRRLRLEVEPHAIAAWVSARLIGRAIEGLHVDEVALEPTNPSHGFAGPCLLVAGERRGRRAWIMFELQLLPQGRKLALRSWRAWRIGEAAPAPAALWRGVAACFQGELDRERADTVVIDPVRQALLRPFLEAGWRVPDLGGLIVQGLSLGPDRAELSLGPRGEGGTAAPIPSGPMQDTGELAARLAAVHAALQTGEAAEARIELERMVEALPPEHLLRLPALRWLATLARHREPARALHALRGWLHVHPRDTVASRDLLVALGRSGDHRGLAQRLAGECRLPNSPRRQARLELALACVLVDRLDDDTAGIDMLVPLQMRTVTDPRLRELELPVRAALARARAASMGTRTTTEAVADDALRDALALTEHGATRVSVQAGVAAAFARRGHHRKAAPLWREIVHFTPADGELVQSALASVEASGDEGLAIELMRTAIPHATPSAALALRRRLATTLLGREDPTSRELAHAELRALVRDHPESRELALELAALERGDGQAEQAAARLDELAQSSDDLEDRARLRLEQARILAEGGEPRRAWAKLQPVLDGAPPRLEAELLELAVTIAPLSVRNRLIDRLAEIDDGPRSGRALLARAHARHSKDQRRADLEAATPRLDDPRPALRELASLAAADEREPWAALARACASRDDEQGEAAARVELALRCLEHDALEAAAEALARARALQPQDVALCVAHGWVLARAHRFVEAAASLAAAPSHLTLGAFPLGDPRLGLPSQREQARGQIGVIWLRAGRPAEAALQLRPAVAALGAAAEPELTQALIEALEALEEHRDASAVARQLAEGLAGAERVKWLLAAARHAEPREAVQWLLEATELAPEATEPLMALERAARSARDDARVGHALQRLARLSGIPATERARAVRELVARGRRAGVEPADDPETIALYELLHTIDGDDVTALLVLGRCARRDGDDARAHALLTRALERLPAGDPRRLEPSVVLARHELSHGEPERARDRLLSVLGQPGVPPEAYMLLAEAAHALGDATTRLRALRGIIAQAEDVSVRLDAELQLARQLGEIGRSREALGHVGAATRGFPRGSAEHIDAARVWLALAMTANDPREEAAARVELRRGLGGGLSAKELRTEALLLAERLADPEGARAIVEEGLAAHPTDPLLLSTLKHLVRSLGAAERYLVALDAAVEGMGPGPERDRLASELAMAAAEAGDAALAHRAIERLSLPAGDDEALLDLRAWAVRRLGLEPQELQRIDERLRTEPPHAGLLRRLAELVGEGEPLVEHLLDLGRDAEPEVAQRLVGTALELAEPLSLPSLSMKALRLALRVQALPAAEAAWPALAKRVSAAGDDASLADLVALADDAHQAGLTLDEQVARQLDEALAHTPASPHLHRALARHLALRGLSPAQLHAEHVAQLDAIADRYELPGLQRAELFIGMAEPMDRRAAAGLLSGRAEAALDDAAVFGRLVRALETRQCWPEVLRLLRARVATARSVDEQVASLKHLAHVTAEVLGDPPAAVVHLEAALALAPTDPDLLLPLLEHHFSQTDLGRAVALTERVLEHVRMGDAAFAALAHRAADAAIAQDDPERALALLERITGRVPADTKALARITELHERTDEPARRVVLLAAVATRQSGKARIEALEERARLLLGTLGRPLEAMEDLAAVVADAPDRQASADLLAALYREHGRFIELVELRESDLPRRHGLARARLLAEIAALQHEGLRDLPRAEQALHLAIEQLGVEPEEQALADELREALSNNLEQQGRIVDLAAWLEQELRAELEPADGPPPPAPRLALLQRLARLLRERLDDEARATELYEQLERWHALPDEGLATLARWYRRSGRHEALVRVLQLRARALPESSERRAAIDLHIAELLDGPLARPHEAARHYLDAFLADPDGQPAAGARARVLLCAVDSVINVRDRLRRRLDELDRSRRPALLAMLAELLAPHEAHEEEAEAHYREALALDDQLATAHEGLGRLLGRRGRKDEAARALVAATERPGLSPARVADAAALAARLLIELQRFDEAEAVLRRTLEHQPNATRVLMELARLFERCERSAELAAVLDQVAQLPLPSAMQAEVAYRRALLLQPVYDVVPHGPQGERARSHLLEALGANPRHAAARQALLTLATARCEWSIVAHMHYLAIRELPPGASRASVHLELAAAYLDHLSDPDSAMRNIESALQQAPTDVVVTYQTGELARRMPDHAAAAARFETIAAATDNELDDAARARLWLLSADLRMMDDDRDAAEIASRRVLGLPAAPEDAAAAATRTLARIQPSDPASLVETSEHVLAQLDGQPPLLPQARAELLAKLHDIGVELDDPGLVERATREQVELAANLDESDDRAETTGAFLRELLAARGEYGAVVQLYERLATQAGGNEDPARAAAVLVEAAGYAWRGQKQPAQAASLLGRALALAPAHEAATRMLGELAHEATEPAACLAIQQALGDASRAPPALRLQLARLAAASGDEEQALARLRPLAEPDVPEDVRFEALARLDALLSERGEQRERRRVLEAWLSLALSRQDARAGDLGLEVARLQHDEGNRAAARRTCEAARRVAPEHRELLGLLAELAEQDEDWPSTVELFESLARLSVEDEEHAGWLTRAAAIHLRRPELHPGGDGSQVARRLLLRAAEIAPRSPEPRVALLPLAFSQARWDEVLELAEAIVAHDGHDDEALGPAALVEAYRRGERRLAREIGFRHPIEIARSVLLPALQQLLGEVAARGPLPRLDALLAAGSSLLGGRRHLFEALHGWASEQPPDSGLALGLARLFEARGAGDLARHHYQLAAFMAPRGPVPALVARLPSGWFSDTDLHRVSTAPMEGRSALREVLAALRDHLTGIGTRGAPQVAPAHARTPSWWPARMELAETIVEPWRAILGVDLPLAWTEDALPGGVAVRNDRPPRIVLGRACADQTLPELTFRLASATAGVALGTTVLEARQVELGALLDALGQLANPAHQPTGVDALGLADLLAAREARSIGLAAGQRSALLDELAHWLTTPGGLARLDAMLRRSRLLLATRLGAQLDGALLAIARDHGLVEDGRIDAGAALRVADAMWLLRALSLR